MLFGEQFGRRHQGRLPAAAHGARRRCRCDDRLAAADIALHQADHRLVEREVGVDVGERAPLRAGERVRQAGDEAGLEPGGIGERPSGVLVCVGAQPPHHHLVCEQFLEGEPLLRGMAARVELIERCVERWPVHEAQGVAQRRQSGRQRQPGRQPVAHPRGLEFAKRLADQHPQPTLCHAFGHRIDRRQRILRRSFVGRDAPVFGMHHLEADRTPAYLAEAADACPAREALLLRSGEMEETQRQEARTVGDAAQQLPTTTEGDLGELYLALHHAAGAADEAADRQYAGAVFVARRQHEEEILHLFDAEDGQARSERLADAAQCGDGSLLARLAHRGSLIAHRSRAARAAPRRVSRGGGCSRSPRVRLAAAARHRR